MRLARYAAIGLSNWTILRRHIVPNAFHLIIIDFSLNIVGYVQAEVVLSFLGLGITDKPSWGRMIDDARLELVWQRHFNIYMCMVCNSSYSLCLLFPGIIPHFKWRMLSFLMVR